MQIIFNGKSYNSVEEMPERERQAFEHMKQIFVDANGNGIPDFMEGDMVRNIMASFSSNVNFNGKVYNSLDEIPPEAKEKVQQALEKLKQLGIVTEIPSLQGTSGTPGFEPAFTPSQPLLTPEPPADESTRPVWILVAIGVVVLMFAAAAVAAFLFLR